MPSNFTDAAIVQAARPEVWKFLLGVYPADSTTDQRRALREVKAAEYAQLKQQWQTISRPQAQRFAKWREVCQQRLCHEPLKPKPFLQAYSISCE